MYFVVYVLVQVHKMCCGVDLCAQGSWGMPELSAAAHKDFFSVSGRFHE